MRTFFRKILSKIRKDAADTVLTTVVIALPLLVIVLGFMIDVGKNMTTKNTFQAMAQTSAETAVKEVNGSGSVDYLSARAFVYEYAEQYSNNTKQETNDATLLACDSAVVDGVEQDLPIIRIGLSVKRGTESGTSWTISGDDVFKASKIKSIINDKGSGRYRVLDAEVITAGKNIFGLGGSILNGGNNCQIYRTDVSAIAFGSNTDLSEFKTTPAAKTATKTITHCPANGSTSTKVATIKATEDYELKSKPSQGSLVYNANTGLLTYSNTKAPTKTITAKYNVINQYNGGVTTYTLTIKNGCNEDTSLLIQEQKQGHY